MLIIRYQKWILVLQCFAAFLLFFLTVFGSNSLSALIQYYMAIIWLIIAVFNLFRNRILVINTHALMVKNAIGFNAFKFKLKDIHSVEVLENRIYINHRAVYKHSFLFLKKDFIRVEKFLNDFSNDPNLNIHLIESDES